MVKLMEKKYIVKLTNEERDELNKILSNGNASAKKHKIARVLLRVDSSERGMGYTDADIVDEIEISAKTVTRLRKKFVDGGLEEVFKKKFTPRYSRRKFDGEGEARLIAICCSEAPEGRARWTLKLLADKVVELKIVENISEDTIGRALKKTNLNLGKKKNGVSHQKQMQNLSAKWKTC
jgi:transposase